MQPLLQCFSFLSCAPSKNVIPSAFWGLSCIACHVRRLWKHKKPQKTPYKYKYIYYVYIYSVVQLTLIKDQTYPSTLCNPVGSDRWGRIRHLGISVCVNAGLCYYFILPPGFPIFQYQTYPFIPLEGFDYNNIWILTCGVLCFLLVKAV